MIAVTPDSNQDSNQDLESNSEETVATDSFGTGVPALREAIEEIGGFEFNLDQGVKEEAELEAFIAVETMYGGYSKGPNRELPTLGTEVWPYEGKAPDPVSIGTARRFLAAGYARIYCPLEEAGEHGYAWIIETPTKWAIRKGTQPIEAPTKPKKPTEYSVRARLEYADKTEEYATYKHLANLGIKKLIEWFGKAVFSDLHLDGALPPDVTPKKMLEHIEDTYADYDKLRMCGDEARATIMGAYDPKKSIEECFAVIQNALYQLELLDTPLALGGSDGRYLQDVVVNQLQKHYGKDVSKANDKWHKETTADEKTWDKFKTYWKEEINRLAKYNEMSTKSKNRKYANQVAYEDEEEEAEEPYHPALWARMQASYQAEIESLRERATKAEDAQFQQSYQAHQAETQAEQNSDQQSLVSALTQLTQDVAALKSQGNRTQGTTSLSKDERIHIARNRNPKDYKSLNGGKGKQFQWYCWKCGVNCTHGTRFCYELDNNQKKKFKDATPTNTMGGSTKLLDRHGKYQSDYGFDSL